MEYIDRMNRIVSYINERTTDFAPEFGIILGTGLGALTEKIKIEKEIEYMDIPEFPVSTVAGHEGKLIFGTLSGRKVVAMKGRFHFYEGYPMTDVTLPVRVMKKLGAHTLVVSNACGGLNPNFKPGDIMIITDHINFMGTNPLIGLNLDEFGPRFPDMSSVYDKEAKNIIQRIAKENGFTVQEGIYTAVSGPNYASKAELTMLIIIGSDAIGMSTVPEAIVAKHSGMKVIGISCITDMAIPDASMTPPDHQEILKVAEGAKEKFTLLVEKLIQEV